MGALKSDLGAQAAWRGFSSQTLYIAYRLVLDSNGYEYYPEDIEDLVVKKDGRIIEAIQVKNVTNDLTISTLASSTTSKNGDGFFKRICSLHHNDPDFCKVIVAYFHSLGSELEGVQKGNQTNIKSVEKKLREKHNLSAEEASWLVSALSFEKVDQSNLETTIEAQIKSYVPTMAAPTLAKDMLIQYISELSRKKGFTTLAVWNDMIHSIGVNISAIDGFYKEYNKSLVRLDELQLGDTIDSIKNEYLQGASAHPSHIRANLDFIRDNWLVKIKDAYQNENVVIVKGVSGQGKSSLCYRYLIDNFSEGKVFCIRELQTPEQALNLVTALDGLGKHINGIVIYIDVVPGETLWATLLQELQVRGLSIPVLISIRDEDFNATPLNGRTIQFELIELLLTKEEAEIIYKSVVSQSPRIVHRTFEEAWLAFGGKGPLIEFTYLLTNNQTLKDRLSHQIDALLQEGIEDSWIDLLQMICLAGRLGCQVDYNSVKEQLSIATLQSALCRLKDEYLIRITTENTIEALHPVRAQIVYSILKAQTFFGEKEIVLKTLPCITPRNARIILMDYFSHNEYDSAYMQRVSALRINDWIRYSSIIKTSLWLDAKRYYDCNEQFFHSLVERYGSGWMCLIPLDLSGFLRPNVLLAEAIDSFPGIDKKQLESVLSEVKEKLSSLSLDYPATQCFLHNSIYPRSVPQDDEERTAFGYSLFWMAKLGISIELSCPETEIINSVSIGELQPRADAIRGLCEQTSLVNCYNCAIDLFTNDLIKKLQIVFFSVSENEVSCKFIPPMTKQIAVPKQEKNYNQFWRIKMLNILQQLYPYKEYIDIELIGVDLLRDLGIPAMDHKLHIHKDNRVNGWIAETNSLVKNRVEYVHRPNDWESYVKYIDEIRVLANELNKGMIEFIDDIYKKERYTKERWRGVEDRIRSLKRKLMLLHLLPQTAIDPYCIYSEDNTKEPIAEFFTMTPLLSVKKYSQFKKLFNDVYTSLDNYYSQFSTVLLARINKQEIPVEENPQLSMINLYNAGKNLSFFQIEYNHLFHRYSTLTNGFDVQETENLLVLINMWNTVIKTATQRHPIAYDAKQLFRHGASYFRDKMDSIIAEIGAGKIDAEKHEYIIFSCSISDGADITKEVYDISLKLHDEFKDAIEYTSNRWYCETQPLEIALIPSFDDSLMPIAFQIPFYRIFDQHEQKSDQPLLPCDIEESVFDSLWPNQFEKIWNTCFTNICEIKTILEMFKQTIEAQTSSNCDPGFETYVEYICGRVHELWNEITPCSRIIEMIKNKYSEESDTLGKLENALSSDSTIIDCIATRSNPQSVIDNLSMIVGFLIVLQRVVREDLKDLDGINI